MLYHHASTAESSFFCLISGFCGYHRMEKNTAGTERITYNNVRKTINSSYTIDAFCALEVPKVSVSSNAEVYFRNFLSFLGACNLLCHRWTVGACNLWWWNEAGLFPPTGPMQCLCRALWQHRYSCPWAPSTISSTSSRVSEEPTNLFSHLHLQWET